ncbi:MAG TPA: energy transducer TonB [Verrucomicrobiae bacterium]|nr:energy transducer TonB [Verrucomicrobiae bacterium]
MFLIGDVSVEERRHAAECEACGARVANLAGSIASFRGAVRNWSEQTVEQRWTVIPGADHLGRLLLPASLDVPWYRSLWSGVAEIFQPAPPPLDITSRPVLVRAIWGQYGRQKKSWVMSVGLQSAVVLSVFAAAVTPAVQHKIVNAVIPLVAPVDPAPYQQKAAVRGGGGGGDRSTLDASKGRLPKPALKQFTPPMAVVANLNPKLSMDPTIIAPPDLQLPDVNMTQFGDPLGRIGPASNGPGSGGGIGPGKGGGVGVGDGPGFGPGEGGGVSGGVYRVGGGVSAPSLLSKVEPEYSEEARKAKHQGVVLLYIEVDPAGRAQNVRVLHSLGLGLDEKAMEAVKKWKFRPGMKDGRPVTVAATIEVSFRLL